MRPLPDAQDREAIRNDLGTNLLVEASAGTGKTHELILRMVNLVADAGVPAGRMAAVTFTRRATAELRQKFQIGLEEAIRSEADPARKDRIRTALGEIDACFIGTIHAFCGELLRERPVEGGLAPGFREVPDDDPELVELRDRVWREEIERLESPAGEAQLDELLGLGVEPDDLKICYEILCGFAEVDFPSGAEADAGPVAAALGGAAEETARFLDSALADLASAPRVKMVRDGFAEIRRSFDSAVAGDAPAAASALGIFERRIKDDPEGGSRETAGRRWKEAARSFREQVVVPALTAWRQFLYPRVLAVAARAEAEFRGRRQRRALVGFTDLLRLARDLLRDDFVAREDLAGRFSRILVDEFQDTDPLQAEFLLYLTGENIREKDWTKLRPRPGSLFVVGDPKQAIYRFRRADLAAYAEFKRVFLRAGREVRLSASHRSVPGICEFVNRSFEAVFLGEGDERQAGAARLDPARDAPRQPAVLRLTVETTGSEKQAAAAVKHAEKAADYVASELNGGEMHPPDFLLLASARARLRVYQRALEKRGIPAVILTGSEKSRPEDMMPGLLGFASLIEAAAAPTEPLPTVAFLRSGLCGASDEDLLRFRDAGGRFEAFATLPSEAGDRIASGLRLLRRCVEDAESLPPSAAVARLAEWSGLFASGAAEEEPESACATASRVLTLARRLSAEGRSFREVAAELAALIREARVSATTLSSGEDAVRLMTIHSAKGLQARVVLLVDPAGDDGPDEPELHVERSVPPRGYLEVARISGGGDRKVRTVLAQPQGWEGMAELELVASEAEIERRRYVAATRAEDRLIVGINLHSTKDKPNPQPRGQWSAFQPFLDRELPASMPASPIESRGEADLAAEIGAAREETARRGRLLSRATYRVEAVTHRAPEIPLVAAPAAADGRGPAFGRVMHRLLEALMRDPGRDFRALAAFLVDAEELPTMEVDEVVRLTEAVRASGLWRRAQGADVSLVEVPFVVPLEGDGSPGVLRGAVDLAFREGDRWWIVDYKSDRLSPGRLEALITRYRPQVECYRREWERFSGKPTRAGLCFLERPEEPVWLDS